MLHDSLTCCIRRASEQSGEEKEEPTNPTPTETCSFCTCVFSSTKRSLREHLTNEEGKTEKKKMKRKDLIHLWWGWFIPRKDDYCINVQQKCSKVGARVYRGDMSERRRNRSRSHNVNDDKVTMTMTLMMMIRFSVVLCMHRTSSLKCIE